jgi:hypothetical protein
LWQPEGHIHGKDRLSVTKRKKHIAQVQPEIDGLFNGVTIFREMLQSTPPLLEARHCFSESRMRFCLSASLSVVEQGFVPDFPLQGMMGRPFDMLM